MARPELTVYERLFQEGYVFDFFQAVRLLEHYSKDDHDVGVDTIPGMEAVRFKSHIALDFPASAIYEVRKPTPAKPMPVLVQTFFGLVGTTGVLPRHYTELILRHEREHKGVEVQSLREWFDLFNHRLLSLFYRAWRKYRFWLAFEKGEFRSEEPDISSRSLYSLVGLGMPSSRQLMRVCDIEWEKGQPKERILTQVDDLVTLYFAGFFAQQTRNALGLEAMLEDFFGIPVEVEQFQGQWLQLDADNRSYLGEAGTYNLLGENVVVGQRVWDVQSRLRIRLGPLPYAKFLIFFPDPAPIPEGKTFFQLLHLIRLYVGAEFEIEVQLVLQAAEVPECQLPESTADGPRLGWNTWIGSQSHGSDTGDAIFLGEEKVVLSSTSVPVSPSWEVFP